MALEILCWLSVRSRFESLDLVNSLWICLRQEMVVSSVLGTEGINVISHGIVWVKRDLKYHLVSTSCQGHGHPKPHSTWL